MCPALSADAKDFESKLLLKLKESQTAILMRRLGLYTSQSSIYNSGLPSRILICTELSGRWRVFILDSFLADRRAYATALCLSVCLSVCRRRRLSVTLCIVAKRCVLEQKLLLRAYRKSYMKNRLVPK